MCPGSGSIAAAENPCQFGWMGRGKAVLTKIDCCTKYSSVMMLQLTSPRALSSYVRQSARVPLASGKPVFAGLETTGWVAVGRSSRLTQEPNEMVDVAGIVGAEEPSVAVAVV